VHKTSLTFALASSTACNFPEHASVELLEVYCGDVPPSLASVLLVIPLLKVHIVFVLPQLPN